MGRFFAGEERKRASKGYSFTSSQLIFYAYSASISSAKFLTITRFLGF